MGFFTDKICVLSASPRELAAIRPQVDRSEVTLNNDTTPEVELTGPVFLGGSAGSPHHHLLQSLPEELDDTHPAINRITILRRHRTRNGRVGCISTSRCIKRRVVVLAGCNPIQNSTTIKIN